MHHAVQLPSLFTIKPAVYAKRSTLHWPRLSFENQPWTAKIGLCEPLPEALLGQWIASSRFAGARQRMQWVMDNPSVKRIWPEFICLVQTLYAQNLVAVMAKAQRAGADYNTISYHAAGFERVHFAVEPISWGPKIDLPYEKQVSEHDRGALARKKGRILPWGEPLRFAHELRIHFYRSIERAFEQRWSAILHKISAQDRNDLIDLIHCRLVVEGLHPEQVLRNRDYLNQTYLKAKAVGEQTAH